MYVLLPDGNLVDVEATIETSVLEVKEAVAKALNCLVPASRIILEALITSEDTEPVVLDVDFMSLEYYGVLPASEIRAKTARTH